MQAGFPSKSNAAPTYVPGTLRADHLPGRAFAGRTPQHSELCALPGLLRTPAEADGTCLRASLSKTTEELLWVLSQKRVPSVALSTDLVHRIIQCQVGGDLKDHCLLPTTSFSHKDQCLLTGRERKAKLRKALLPS